METLAARLEETLRSPGPLDPRLAGALGAVAERFGARVGTLHLLDADGATLRLRAHLGSLPPAVLDAARAIPFGKGIAGLAAQRRAPVSTCNLQTDASGVARPRARETGLRGTLCVPMLDGEELVGTLGVGCEEEREFTPAEAAELLAAGSRIARAVRGGN
ncbi:MAG TPA: GAF domain-containing protein [Planctomycetota bacterium]|jgi:GAF domain-containing protein|nr:GAF domain-containing protein [Planctomycetota bacterium]